MAIGPLGIQVGNRIWHSRVLDKREFRGTTPSESQFCPRAFLRSKFRCCYVDGAEMDAGGVPARLQEMWCIC